MIFQITTNHKVALQIKLCFESKALALEKDKGISLKNITVENGYAVLDIGFLPTAKTQSVFFLGIYAESQKLDIEFNSFGCLPLHQAKALLKL